MPRVRTVRVTNADAFEKVLGAEKRAVPIGVAASAEPIQRYLELKVSIPYPPASAPGQPAHRRTGKYKRDWNVKPRNLTLTIKNTVGYSMFLERGTRKMKARPALTKTLAGGAGNAERHIRRAGRTAADTARRAPIRQPRN